jgi:hypothetical protein
MDEDALPANKDSSANKQPATSTCMEVDVLPTPSTSDSARTPPPIIPPSPSPLRASCPTKYISVLQLFDTEVKGGL